uniref:Uncharacterized protein n=1 Tax=Romanomermis culicivorax TaxID=13658 RepID=A0A915L5M7_ROMCU
LPLLNILNWKIEDFSIKNISNWEKNSRGCLIFKRRTCAGPTQERALFARLEMGSNFTHPRRSRFAFKKSRTVAAGMQVEWVHRYVYSSLFNGVPVLNLSKEA